MKIPVKKLKNGFNLPVYGLGTWGIGGGNSKEPTYDVKNAIKSLQQALELGIRHIDTAEVYAQGFTEEIVGVAIKGLDRKQLYLTSKVISPHLGYKDLIQSCKTSLKRLKTDYLDLYLIHRPDPSTPLDETMSAMDYLIEKGWVKYIGVSNFTNQNLEKAQRLTKNKIMVNQVHYNLIHREIEKFKLLEYVQANQLMLIAYTPIQKGLLAGEEFEILKKLAKKYNKTVVQIAINWLVSQPNIVTIAKTENITHLTENLGGVGWKMEDKDIELLRNEFPNQRFNSKSYLADIRNDY